jgi:CheY-like chemotaxis protein
MKKILVIDDEPLVRRSLQRAFEAKKCLVFIAADGRSGLEIWKKELPDIVFLDVLMPGLSGPEVLQEVTPEVRSQSYVVLISAYAGTYDLESAKTLGADYFFPKPFENIFAIVEKSLEMVK